jgi:co-chaperonin GroES (HSP10)
MASSPVAALRPSYSYNSIDEAFPAADAGVTPFGSRVLVQIRSARQKSAGGIILTQQDRQTDFDNTQVAKVIALGPAAFRNRDTLTVWPEGEWAQPGAFVRVPKYGGDRWFVDIPNLEAALFVLFNDLDLVGEITCDPLSVVAYF